MGIGAQDDFDYAIDFVNRTQVFTPDMIWDPSFATWQTFGIRINSQMMVMSSDLTAGSELLFGFGPDVQESILNAADTLA